MIQDIEPRKFDNCFRNVKAGPEDLFLAYNNDSVLVMEDSEKLWYPSFSDFGGSYPELARGALYLFTIDETRYFLVKEDGLDGVEGWSYVSTRHFRTERKKWRAFAGVVGLQLSKWYENHVFCSRCGNKTIPSEKERMLYCEKCGFMVYPKISPCVIVGVYNKDKLLLTKYAGRTNSNFALVAGFVEIGESFENAVKREVLEEVGVKVKNIRFYKSQPWPFTDTILAGFFAQLDGDDTLRIQEEELETGVWMKREDIPPNELKISLTGEMMEVFKKGYVT